MDISVNGSLAEEKTVKIKEITLRYRWRVAHLLLNKSSTASRNVMTQFKLSSELLNLGNEKASTQYCQNCGSIFLSENCSVKIKSRKPPNKRKRQRRKRNLTFASHLQERSVLKLHCKTCNFVNELLAASAQELPTTPKTPNSSFFETPKKTSTPVRRLNQSLPILSKAQRKKKNSSSSRLSAMLNQSSNSSLSSSLTDFLSNL